MILRNSDGDVINPIDEYAYALTGEPIKRLTFTTSCSLYLDIDTFSAPIPNDKYVVTFTIYAFDDQAGTMVPTSRTFISPTYDATALLAINAG